MPPLTPPDEEDYDSAADSDFAASISPSSGEDSEASGDEPTAKGSGSRKRKVDADGDVSMASGDEGIVAQARKKQKRRQKRKGKGAATHVEEEEDEGAAGEGGVGIRVKLRSGRGGEAATQKAANKTTGATIDIDSVWARLNSARAPPPSTPSKPTDTTSNTENVPPSSAPTIAATSTPEATITIPHTYIFAGVTHTSTKTVLASSPEAQAYLASKDKTATFPTGPPLRRPLARKGLLEPNPTLTIKGRPLPPRADLPSSIGGQGTKSLGASAKTSQWEIGKGKEKARKLNTVEKSKMDWEAEVERQGMREELEKAEKSGGSYLGRMEFLGRGDRAREEEARLHRLKEMGMQA
ncbi:hypothetical protein P7C71_g4853, partial [Lecanoromycetidae sp. Uapishka_2]